jgi:hypothetical protein
MMRAFHVKFAKARAHLGWKSAGFQRVFWLWQRTDLI